MPTFRTMKIAELYEAVKHKCHEEYPFQFRHRPCEDMTEFVMDCLAHSRSESIFELWSYIRGRGQYELLLEQGLRVDPPSWLEISERARLELKAIYLLTMRMENTTHALFTASDFASTVIASRDMRIDPCARDGLVKSISSERDFFVNISKKKAVAINDALDVAQSPLGDAEPCALKMKTIPPMPRYIVADYVNGNYSNRLRYDFDWDYGIGDESGKRHIGSLGFFTIPEDDTALLTPITKEALSDALTKNGVSFKKSDKKDDLIAKARGVPGLVPSLIDEYAPDKKVLSPDWEVSVKAWAGRVKDVRLVAIGIIKAMAADALGKGFPRRW